MAIPKVGVVNAATPTPLNPDGSYDRESGRSLAQRWLRLELDGVLVLGSMGEGLYLSDEARNGFLETALEEAGDKLTIFVSAADTSRARMRERALRYAKMGAPCVMLALPPERAASRAICDVKSVADACPVPCAYYEIPARTGTPLVLDEILDILTHENIVVCKDSSNNPLLAEALTAPAYRPAACVLLDGSEYRTPFSRQLGYDGVLHGGGVLTGRWIRAIWKKAQGGTFSEAVEMDRKKALFLAQVYNRFSRPLRNTIGQKYALTLLGAMASDAVVIDQDLDESARANIRNAVESNREWLV